MKKAVQITVIILSIGLGVWAEAKTVRATEVSALLWSKLATGTASDLTVEFREGDVIPVTLASEGDFLETTQVGTSSVQIKRNFWLQLQNNILLASLDGTTFKPIGDIVTGGFTAGGWSGRGPVNAINLALQAFLK